ncbi:MAG: serine hydrolase [Chitinophagaceae bacterium]|nr:serine hydrolase [Chitinophagaceae bacterium]
MTRQKSSFVSVLLLLLLHASVTAQNTIVLPRSVPEKEGVSSASIINFLDAARKSKNEFHSFMMLRHGNVIAEGWWNPYRADLKHTMYSCSKSFTATAIGFAVQEKLLTVNDKVISFFPTELPDTISPYLAELTVRDVLSMSDGQDPDPTFTIIMRDSNWVKTFLATPIVHEPGKEFLYNTLGTYMLSAIVQKATGQKVLDYLRPRLFEPLGIQDIDWEEDTKGINTGGWGLRINTEGMAKFGQLFLQKGKWKDKQILPVAWIEEASTMKIMQDPEATQSKKDSSDWMQGYCYQMWRCRYNAYRGDGAYGQFIIVMPEQDAVIAITAETPDMQNEINLVWQYLLPAIQQDKLPVNKTMTANLKRKLHALALPLSLKSSSVMASSIAGKTFDLEPNEKHLQNITFNFNGNICRVILKSDTAVHTLDFGAGSWQKAETNKPGPSLLSTAKENFTVLARSKVAGSYHWNDKDTLELVMRYIESPHTETFICRFDKKNLSLTISNSFDFGNKKTTLKGSVK